MGGRGRGGAGRERGRPFPRVAQVAMRQDTTMEWTVVNWSINAVFIVDMVLQFFMAYQESTKKGGTWVTHRPKIVKHYLRTWFPIDLVSVFPFQQFSDLVVGLMGTEVNSGNTSILRAIRTIRLIRLIKIFRLGRVPAIAALASDEMLHRLTHEDEYEEIMSNTVPRVMVLIAGTAASAGVDILQAVRRNWEIIFLLTLVDLRTRFTRRGGLLRTRLQPQKAAIRELSNLIRSTIKNSTSLWTRRATVWLHCSSSITCFCAWRWQSRRRTNIGRKRPAQGSVCPRRLPLLRTMLEGGARKGKPPLPPKNAMRKCDASQPKPPSLQRAMHESGARQRRLSAARRHCKGRCTRAARVSGG